MKKFNYGLATQEQINAHVLRMSPQSISKMFCYHLALGHTEIAEKIKKARELTKANRAIASLKAYLDSVNTDLPQATTS